PGQWGRKRPPKPEDRTGSCQSIPAEFGRYVFEPRDFGGRLGYGSPGDGRAAAEREWKHFGRCPTGAPALPRDPDAGATARDPGPAPWGRSPALAGESTEFLGWGFPTGPGGLTKNFPRPWWKSGRRDKAISQRQPLTGNLALVLY